jgi:2-keto-3-deoxy-L-rhamnonate aldolase RhmA
MRRRLNELRRIEEKDEEMTKGMSFKQKLRAGIPQIGIRTQLSNPGIAEALGFCGYDYIYIDMEHSTADLATVVSIAQAIAGTPAASIVRIPSNDVVLIQRLLDSGLENIVVPMVENAEEAARAASAVRYPPRGTRSVARVHRGNAYGTDSSYVATLDDRLCLGVQIESGNAVNNAFEIASVDGVDAVFFGPGDLAADLGHIGKADHPDVVAAIRRAMEEIGKAGKFSGTSTANAELGARWLGSGCAFVSIAGDLQTLTEASIKLLGVARSAVESGMRLEA